MSAISSECATQWTEEQALAIERREGNLLLDAGAGSGKTSVLVERFVRAVLEDGVAVEAILTITFTDKAAAELRDRVRVRLRALGADQAARETEGAYISTIHGFCARVLRAHALAAGIDPRFQVLDQPEAERLADAALDEALVALARERGDAVELVASYTVGVLRAAILGTYAELRSRGETDPELPALPPAPDPDRARARLSAAAQEVLRELGEVSEPSVRVIQALERLARCEEVIAPEDPGLAELDALKLPGGNGAALSTDACAGYADALAEFRRACEHRRAVVVHGLLDGLLKGFGESYARRKRECSALDFADLELMTRDLLRAHGELRERYRDRFAHVMVDELQDTNAVQLELIEAVAADNLFTVGDAQQSIYGFRHADVELFERLGEERSRAGERATLQTNFRSRREILDVINAAFAGQFGERFMALRPGRREAPAGEPRVELLVADKGADWAAEGLAAPWRLAEAQLLAGRVRELLADGIAPREVVVLTRATTDLRAYEQALEQRGMPTYVIGGRGYWGHPQVLDIVAYLRALANPRDEEALLGVLASPLVGASLDALVVLAAAARAQGRDPWWTLREPEGALDELAAQDSARLAGFTLWFGAERGAAGSLGIEELIDRVLARTGYDLEMLAMPGGLRRLANVRKLMRLGREFEATNGPDLRGFLTLVHGRATGRGGFGDARESEAPVEGEALDAIRLMTIHRAKGLEFETVCVADLGRGPRWVAPLIRLGRDGRFGLRLSEPGTTRPVPALDYRALGEQQLASEEQEERRLFYVAMTRARERLILSGAANLEAPDKERSPMGWIAPAMIDAGVQPRYVRSAEEGWTVQRASEFAAQPPATSPAGAIDEPPEARRGVARLSYSSLQEYARCGYRFYAQRVLGLPPVQDASGTAAADGLNAAERGVLVHSLLERLDFRRGLGPSVHEIADAAEQRLPQAEVERIATLIGLFMASEICARVARCTDVRREERFAFLLEDDVLITGALDVLAREPGRRMLVLDYKSDRIEGADPVQLVSEHYATQQLIYGLAALRAGASAVHVVHLFLEAPSDPVLAEFGEGDQPELERRLAGLAAGARRREFRVTDQPHRGICNGCPAEGGLCSWPLELTRREAPDRLF